METNRRMPLHDLPLEHFLTPSLVTATKSPRKHKRPLSPSHSVPLNTAKRRVLDSEGILLSNNVVASSYHPVPFMLSNTHSVTPTRPSRLGNGLTRSFANSQATSSPSSSQSHRRSPTRDPYPKPILESSVDPQSRHYPGFDIFRDGEHSRASPLRVSLPSDGDTPVDRSEEEKENIPLKRKAKKICSKKRLLPGLDTSDVSCLGTLAQTNKVVRPERTPFSARQPLR